MTVKELVAHYDAFLAAISAGNASTKGTYERALRSFIAWFAVDGRFHFRERDIERYKKHLVERRQYRATTVGTYLSALRRFCEHLVDRGAIALNPAAGVVAGGYHATHSRRPLSDDEIDQLLLSVDRSSLGGSRDFAIIHLMLGCALMEHEICSLRVRDVVREADAMSLRLGSERIRGAAAATAVPPAAAAALEEYLDMRFGTRPGRHDRNLPLFATAGNRASETRLSERTVRHAISRWLIASGVKQNRTGHITPLSLRHSSGYRLASQGASVEDVMSHLRLESTAAAMLYFATPQCNGSRNALQRAPFVSDETASP